MTHLQCDEEKPQCRRCTRARRACPGYPEISVFLSMNDDFSTPVTWASSVQSSSFPENKTRGKRSHSKPCDDETPLLLSRGPSTDWSQPAICYFFRNFVSNLARPEFGYLAFLPDLYAQNPGSQCLSDALNAVALTSYSNISSIPSLQLQARQLYGVALRSTCSALQCAATTGSDAPLLASIFLLQKCEVRFGLEQCKNGYLY